MFSRAAKVARPLAQAVRRRAPRRNMSGHGDEAQMEKEEKQWEKISKVMVVIGIPLTACIAYAGHKVEHHAANEMNWSLYSQLPFNRQKRKPAPWDTPECSFFNPACRKAAKEGRAFSTRELIDHDLSAHPVTEADWIQEKIKYMAAAAPLALVNEERTNEFVARLLEDQPDVAEGIEKFEVDTETNEAMAAVLAAHGIKDAKDFSRLRESKRKLKLTPEEQTAVENFAAADKLRHQAMADAGAKAMIAYNALTQTLESDEEKAERVDKFYGIVKDVIKKDPMAISFKSMHKQVKASPEASEHYAEAFNFLGGGVQADHGDHGAHH